MKGARSAHAVVNLVIDRPIGLQPGEAAEIDVVPAKKRPASWSNVGNISKDWRSQFRPKANGGPGTRGIEGSRAETNYPAKVEMLLASVDSERRPRLLRSR